MKYFKILIFMGLLTVFFSCNSSKEAFTINSDAIKPINKQNETLFLMINNPENETIEKVIYEINGKVIGTSLNNNKFEVKLNQFNLGQQNVKAIVFENGNKTECELTFDVYASTEPKISEFVVLNNFSHDTKAYTQGFEFFNGTLLESTGQYGESSLRKTNYKTAAIAENIKIDEKYFAEGITVFNNKLYQLTWQNNMGFIYDATTLKKEKTFNYFKKMDGWGLTHNETELIMSDGSDKIYFLDPNTQKLNRMITVCSNQNKIDLLNELEYIEGKIWANVYQKDVIVIINPTSGAVENVIDFSALSLKVTNPEKEEFNGIAYNKTTNTVFVTGKNWNKTFEIKLK